MTESLSLFEGEISPIVLRRESAILSSYQRTTLPSHTAPSGVVFPVSQAEVQQLVRAARNHKIPLYPISRGNNWGYGSAMAPRSGCVIVDLRKMNRILSVSALGFATIEPGVSQGQLESYLKREHPRWWMDANGAGPDASIVGNLLERGFGHSPLGERARQCSGFEVVLGTGEILRTGFGHYPGAKTTEVYPYGVGPSLDGLFFQSNFGIVTQVSISLMPRPESFASFFFSADNSQLGSLVEGLRELKQEGVLRSTVHLGNALRTLTNKVEYPWKETEGKRPVSSSTLSRWCEQYRVKDWNGLGAVYGPALFVKASLEAIKKKLHPIKVTVMTEEKLHRLRHLVSLLPQSLHRVQTARQALEMITPAMGLLKGEQTDFYLRTSGWRSPNLTANETCPHANGSGLIWVVPVVPACREDVGVVEKLITETYQQHGFDAPITLTFVNERALIVTTNISYNRSDERDTQAAAECYKQAQQMLIKAGYPPYRAGIGGYEPLMNGSEYWKVVATLKEQFDPDHIISPGRYGVFSP